MGVLTYRISFLGKPTVVASHGDIVTNSHGAIVTDIHTSHIQNEAFTKQKSCFLKFKLLFINFKRYFLKFDLFIQLQNKKVDLFNVTHV